MRLRGERLAAVSACLVVLACGADSGVEDVLPRMQAHIDTFVRFEHWVRQANSAELALRGRGALTEATFAPLRGDRSVLAAFVSDRSHGAPVLISWPEASELPAVLPWVAVRHAELGTLRVASFGTCPLRVRGASTHAGGCVIIEKPPRTAPGTARTVTVAFRTGGGA
jgi:hypothetical protein